MLELTLRLLGPEIRGFDVRGRRYVRIHEFERDPSLNSLQFHDVEHPRETTGAKRVMLLGDSYVEASSVTIPNTVGQQLEHFLNPGSESPYEVVSIGRSGWGQNAQYHQLNKLGAIFRPSIVVTIFLSLNDVRNDSPELETAQKEHDRAIFTRRPGRIDLSFDGHRNIAGNREAGRLIAELVRQHARG